MREDVMESVIEPGEWHEECKRVEKQLMVQIQKINRTVGNDSVKEKNKKAE